jgi:hypothetical protein
LPLASVNAMLSAKRLPAMVQDLLIARAIASWRAGDTNESSRLSTLCVDISRAEIKAPVLFGTAWGLVAHLNLDNPNWKDPARSAANSLAWAINTLLSGPPRTGPVDLLDTLMPPRIESVRRSEGADAATAEFENWQKLHPTLIEARLAFARHLLDADKPLGARAVLSDALALDPDNQQMHELQFDIARLVADPGQQGPDLVAQCLRRKQSTPEVASPFGYLLCAEAGLRQETWWIARDSARLAANAFPNARLPRLLGIEASLLGRQWQEAAAAADRLLEWMPPDAESVRLALRARTAAGLPTRDLLVTALPVCAPDHDLAMQALRAALASHPRHAAPFAARWALEPQAPPTLRLLAATAMARAGEPAAARRLLDQVCGEAEVPAAASPVDFASAFAAWLAAASDDGSDADLAATVSRDLATIDVSDPLAAGALLDCAASLASTHPHVANELCVHTLTHADPSVRSGSAFVLAGELACKVRLLQLAEEQWLRALSFADGRIAAERLARLALAKGRSERALLVWELVDEGTDPALAARCGDSARAAKIAGLAISVDRLDLLANATLALIGEKSEADWTATDAPQKDARLELLSILCDDALAPEALERARALDDGSPVARLLLARSLLANADPAAAAAIHEQLAAGDASLLVWREIARACETPDYPLTERTETAAMLALAKGQFATSPFLGAFGLRTLAASLTRKGLSELATQARTTLWKDYASANARTQDPVEAADLPDRNLAWRVLYTALHEQPMTEREHLRERLCGIGGELIAAHHATAPEVYAAAARLPDTDGPYACTVNLLLDHAAIFPTLAPTEQRTEALLRAHLELAASGRDAASSIAGSCRRLATLRGNREALGAIEALLQRFPCCLPLWRARTELLARGPEAARALREHRGVLAHVQAPAETLECLTLAAALGLSQPADAGRLDELPPELRQGPGGTFLCGLLALHEGRAADAAPLLAAGPARDDGLHLWAMAFAALQTSDAEGLERARAAMAELARNYASNTFARNAGSFAAQLGPR